MRLALTARFGLACLFAAAGYTQTFNASDLEFFEAKIRPILAVNCQGCHKSSSASPPGGLALDSRAALLKGGASGPAAIPGRAAGSLIIQAVHYDGPQMPPAGRLPAAQVALLEEWVAKGLPWPNSALPSAPPAAQEPSARKSRWAWEPLHKAAPPSVQNTAAAPTDIDRFIQAKLETAHLKPAAEAGRRTLLRRLSIDLTGLSPTYEQVQTFEHDRSPQAYEAQVDRLLASPQFGERWGRHWLDLARYADSGTLAIRFPLASVYRDWVIDAINRDVPYDRFVTLQLAADRSDLKGRPQDLAALGFIALGNDLYRNSELPERVDDRIDVVSRGLMALTVSCARCHDHKYDPIPTRDYYSLYGVFANTQLLGYAKTIAPAENSNASDAWYEERIAARQKGLDDYRRERLAAILADYRQPAESEKYRKAAEEAHSLSSPRRDAYAREHNLNAYMLERWVRSLDDGSDPTGVPLTDFGWVMTEGDSNTTRELRKEYEQLVSEFAWRGSHERVTAVSDETTLRPAHVLVRGNFNDQGEETPPCFVSVLSGPSRPCFTNGSGRLELASAIFNGPVPIAARVFANRVWQHLFGEGIIRSVSDFGIRGEDPTHPELLDYLAARFQNDGWSVKRLIRSIVLSAAYRRSSVASPEALTSDPENRLLSHMNRRRVDFETLRDSMLLAAGKLDLTPGGRPISLTTIPADPRRTVYTYIERERPLPLLKIFDVADPEQHTPARGITVIPQQALFLMNSPFVQEMSSALAETAAGDFTSAIFRRTLQRDPTAEERKLLTPSNDAQTGGHEALSPWRYGAVTLDLNIGRVASFREFRYFTGSAWQPASMLPDAHEGNASLTANGGSPGDGLANAVSRRWIAPRDMTVAISSTLLQHRNQFAQRFFWTNGVRGTVTSSRAGQIGQWLVDGPVKGAKIVDQDEAKVEANVASMHVTAGEILDFVVDSRDDPEQDAFTWSVEIRDMGSSTVWNATRDFAGPAALRLSARAAAAQVLLMSNEFAFED